MLRAINIVTSCAGRKRREGGEPVRMRDATGPSLHERHRQWQRLLAQSGPRVPAGDLYAGEHWSVARRLPEVARQSRFSPRLWVCSAGYGLIESSTAVRSYGATFRAHDPDSVLLPDTTWSAYDWWELCNQGRTPQGIAGLAEEHPRTPLVVALSGCYLDAVQPDLLNARACLADPDLLVLVSVGSSRVEPPLDQHVVPGAAALRQLLGGTLGSLNIRMVEDAIRSSDAAEFSCSRVRQHFAAKLCSAPKLHLPERTPLSDSEVVHFIRSNEGSAKTHTSMLRVLRQSGFACEQGRFRDLFLKAGARPAEHPRSPS